MMVNRLVNTCVSAEVLVNTLVAALVRLDLLPHPCFHLCSDKNTQSTLEVTTL